MNQTKRWSYALTLVLIVIGYFLLTGLISSGAISRYQTTVMIFICINIILAVSLNITVGCLGQITIGHAGFMSVGAYAAALFAKSGIVAGLPGYIIALIIGGIVAGIIGVIIGIPALRLNGDYLAIITLAFGEIIRVLIEYFDFTGGAQGLRGIPRFNKFGVIYIIMVLCVAMMFSLMTSRHGRAILAIRDDEIASGASGINTTYYKTFAFTVSAIFAGVAGGIYAQNMGILGARQFDFNYSINILVMVVLGGMGSFTGSIISAIALTVLPEVLREFSDYRMIVYSLLLILTMIFRPTGLLGRKEFQISKLVEKFITKRGQQMSNRILHAKDINITFGALRAVSDFNLELREKELVGLIGPNGAGKTTVFNILTGVYSATSGTYTFNGIEVKKTPTYKLVRRGLARTFQNIRLFKNMSVLDNVLVANNFNMKYGVFTGIFRLPKFWLEERRAKKKALKLLRIFDLDKYADTPAGSLPYGQQRKLEIARAMATNPKVLLLDEPAAGMNPTETEELMKTIKLIRDKFGIAILLIEHDMKLVLGICERLIVLDHGTIIASGDPQKVVNDPAVVTAYLGKDDDEIDEEEEENKKIASVKAEIFNDEEEE